MIIGKNKKNDPTNPLDFGEFKQTRLSAHSLRFSSLYQHNERWKRYFIAVACGMVMGVLTLFMLQNTGLYSPGLTGITQGISRIIYVALGQSGMSQSTAKVIYNLLFWGLYFMVNIPLFLFGYKKIGKTFSLLTLVFVTANTAVGLGLSYIPNISDVFLFGRTVPGGETFNYLTQQGVYIVPFSLDIDWGKYVTWLADHDNLNKENIFNPPADQISAILLLVYALVYGIAVSFCYTVIYIVGGCTAGLDFVSIFFATKKDKNLGVMITLFNGGAMVIGSIIGSYAAGGIICPIVWNWQYFLSANLIASALLIVVLGVMLNRLYPIRKHVTLQIYSSNINAICRHLYSINYKHGISIIDATGGYSSQKYNILSTVCLYIELPRVIHQIRKIDDKCLITVSTITDIDGNMRVYQQGSTE